jgi:capsule polysaccharide export protein KpsE/RkpR
MNKNYVSCLVVGVLLFLIQSNIHAQKIHELNCEDVGKIILYTQDEFRSILGGFEMTEFDCNYYFSKVNFGIDSTTTLQSCKGYEGQFVLNFDTYIGNDDIQASIEFRHLEEMLEKCLSKAKVKELKPHDDFKKIIQYTINHAQLTIYRDEVKNHDELRPLVTVSVIKVR